MRESVLKRIEQFNKAQKQRSGRRLLLSALSLCVVLCTVSALLLPAFTLEKTIYCGIDDHEHSLECYSNPDAVESELTWKQTFPTFTDESSLERLLSIASSQLGYRESAENYRVLDDGSVQGWTRYGAWYGDAYGNWDAMLIAFCMHYAGIEVVSDGDDTNDDINAKTILCCGDAASWFDELTKREEFVIRDDYAPHSGDIAFIDDDRDGRVDMVGLVYAVNDPSGEMIAICGNVSDEVAKCAFALDDERVLGYELLPNSLREEDAVWRQAKGLSDASSVEMKDSLSDQTEQTQRPELQSGENGNYTVTVTYGDEAGIPEGAQLDATEILPEDDPETYASYAAKTIEALGLDEQSASYIRLFDIKIVDADDEKVTIAAPVDVQIEFADPQSGENTSAPQVVHFADGEEEGDIIDQVEVAEIATEQSATRALSFEAEGFSVYAIVDAPEPATVELRTVQNANDLASNTDKTFCLSYDNPARYFLSTLNSNNCFNLNANVGEAAEWSFEAAPDGGYYISTLVDGEKRYIQNTSGNLVGLSEEPGTVFELEDDDDGHFYFQIQGENKWLQYSKGGGGIRFWTDRNNAQNCLITITYASSRELEKDPYELDGKSFGIAYHNDSSTSAALATEGITQNNQQRLVGFDMVMKPDVLDNDGILLVAEGSDIQEWTFQSVSKDQYYLTTSVDGQTKYLSISGANVTLVDEPDPVTSLVRIAPGTGANAGKWHFTVNGYSLNLPGTADKGFNGATGSGATTWMNLVQKAPLDDDDFTSYTAKKVSISDTDNVYDGQQVIIYTRIWNDDKKKYEFFAVDHDGSLIPCYDTGDNIEWIGSNINTALWTFTEYTYSDGTPNYYYELQNTQYGEYIAPQLSKDQTLASNKIGINLNGRRFGENYSTIIAWDDDRYAYSGLKAEDGHIVACPLGESEDFYFAIIVPHENQDRISTVNTIDNATYGITMKMVDFNNPIQNANGNAAQQASGGRDSLQTAVLGYNTNEYGLVSSSLEDNGYPVATKSGRSLSELFGNAESVNHLFLESIYNESGYFEYDSTQNFAHLNDDGNFTVYDQIGAVNNYNSITNQHGQFLPYEVLTEGEYCPQANMTSVLAEELPDTDPRKGEKLYDLGAQNDVDYFFGMEMEASFTQTANGLDAWGHDIIFEFSGDDDFWLYVDGELILDVGGVHSASIGTINFRTGEVTTVLRNVQGKTVRSQNTTLRELFEAHYKEKHPDASDEEVEEYLNGIFKDGGTVFKDYTQHTMKMLYMERGAGASNLHMRFNLASVEPGTVVLSKKLSGTESASNSLIEFPYQIFYSLKSEGGTQYHLLEEKTGEAYNVTYKDSIRNVTFKDRLTIDGTEYANAFLLKPGESAVIDLPDDTYDYYIVECGVNTSVYDHVYANGEELEGTGTGDRKDFAVGSASMEDRAQVEYDNHVADGAMRTMSITKWLYDVDGQSRINYPENLTTFSFRLYLGNEYASSESLPLAYLYSYFVKDPNGNYCRWDSVNKCFVSTGIQDYEELSAYLETLSAAEREAIVFATSMNGSISKIPIDHMVEVRDLVAGTQFKVEERDYEIPKGYTLRMSDGYQRIDEGHEENTQTTPIAGTLHIDETPQVVVSNQKGWGLTIQKIWSDKDFMASHDDIYFAVYIKDALGNPSELKEGTIHRLSTSETEVYYFFDQDQMGQHDFSDYIIREVEVVDPVVDSKGVVTSYTSVTPIDEGGTLTNGGTPVGGEHQDGYEYSVTYTIGEPTYQNENVRTDTVTNSRPGIKIYKTDWNWDALADAVFTLKDDEGHDVAAAAYTSDENGLVTIAYVSPGEYTLTETSTPEGYVGLITSMTIKVASDGTITVSGPDDNLYNVVQATESEMTTITIRNREVEFEAIKIDSDGDVPLEGVHFALYRQVTDESGNLRPDYQPIEGFDNLFTDADGVIPLVDLDHLLPATYYLREIEAAEGFESIADDVCFTIGEDKSVSINSEGHGNWLTMNTDSETGKTSFLITVPNSKLTKVSFQKVDSADSNNHLGGAIFDLYQVVDGECIEPAMMSGLVSRDSDGMLVFEDKTVFDLPLGTYHLVETDAPAGYQLRSEPVVITVSGSDAPNGVSYDDGTNLSLNSGKSYDSETKTYLLQVSNTTGFELPMAGGIGTLPFYFGGAAIICAGLLYWLKRRRKRWRGDALL